MLAHKGQARFMKQARRRVGGGETDRQGRCTSKNMAQADSDHESMTQ